MFYVIYFTSHGFCCMPLPATVILCGKIICSSAALWSHVWRHDESKQMGPTCN